MCLESNRSCQFFGITPGRNTGYLAKPIEQSLLYSVLLEVAGITLQDARVSTRHAGRERPQFNARVLVVEDNATNQVVAKGMLKTFGLSIDLVDNGEEALQALEHIPYDLVLMDCQMPVMDGYQASRRIRDPRLGIGDQSLPIVAMTANAMQGDREKCLAAGMNDHIAKPVDLGKLQQALTHWLPERCRLAAKTAEAPSGPKATQNTQPRALTQSGDPVFDYQAFSDRMMGNEYLMQVVAQAFVTDMEEQLEQFRQALDTGDAFMAGELGHKIKGASANMGGLAFSAVALKAVQAGNAGDQEALLQSLPLLEQHFAELKAAMKELLP